MRRLLIALHTVFVVGMLLVILQALDTFIIALAYDPDAALFWWLHGRIHPISWGIYGFFIAVTAGLILYSLYAVLRMWGVLYRMHTADAPLIPNATPPDHPYHAALTAQRARFLGARQRTLFDGREQTLYDYLTGSGHTAIVLQQIAGQPGLISSFLTAMPANRAFLTHFYPPGTRILYDNIYGKDKHIQVLRGNDMVAAYLQHMEAANDLYVEWGTPQPLPAEDHAGVLAWVKAVGMLASRRVRLAMLSLYLRSLGIYTVGLCLMLYMAGFAWITQRSPEQLPFMSFRQTESDIVVFMIGLVAFFIVATLTTPSYQLPRYIAAVAAIISLLPFLAYLINNNIEPGFLVAGLFSLAAGITLSIISDITRRVVRWRTWRAVKSS